MVDENETFEEDVAGDCLLESEIKLPYLSYFFTVVNEVFGADITGLPDEEGFGADEVVVGVDGFVTGVEVLGFTLTLFTEGVALLDVSLTGFPYLSYFLFAAPTVGVEEGEDTLFTVEGLLPKVTFDVVVVGVSVGFVTVVGVEGFSGIEVVL